MSRKAGYSLFYRENYLIISGWFLTGLCNLNAKIKNLEVPATTVLAGSLDPL